MGTTSHKTPLLGLIKKARAEGRAFWDDLSEAERSAQGRAEHWSAKDVMAHVVVANDRLAADLEAAARDEAPPERIEDFNEANRQVFEANRERTWVDLGAYEETVFARLVAAVGALTEDELDDPARFEWTGGRPLWWRVGLTAYYHVLDHVSDLYLERGEADLAQAVQERTAEEMGTLDDSDRWRGTVTYNLACFYTLNGQTGPALERLRRAFRLNPGLIDWSKEDSDLDSLRELPEFQVLYEHNN